MLQSWSEIEAIAHVLTNSKVGKLLPNALYVHRTALGAIHPLLQSYEQDARALTKETKGATLVKFSIDKPKISYLFYPDFDTEPHPALQGSIIIDMVTGGYSYRNYSNSDNPPILHGKETFLTVDYPLYEEFAALSDGEIALGLLDDARYIGRRQEWQQRLLQQRIDFEGHRLICTIEPGRTKPQVTIERHKAAIVRYDFSRPVRLALEAGLFAPGASFFDYGCGHGGDVERIETEGYTSGGWDPYYCPHDPLVEADIVNLGYVINVIEDLGQRREALLKAWQLTPSSADCSSASVYLRSPWGV